ncbi:hypothetical protein [Actinomadura fibrosa]|uniref:DUF4365 domain-containing protein n=1 Tax=Actinomadura fibrosa TaxID=111802 RepID=A0ABW2XAU0_9ACTN|nr:hypothetical protein [Actinomadura fibrosa]
MPSNIHELPLEMVRNRPQLVPELLKSLGVPIPDEPATLTSESYADLNPAELRCDATVLLGDPKKPQLGIVVESQRRINLDKTYSWPAYLTSLRLRRRCPVILLILCPDPATARGCATPIKLGHPEWVLTPLAMSPEDLPPITDPAQAGRLPELAVLSAPAHADGPQAPAVIQALAGAIDALPGDTGPLYYDYVLSRLSDAARKILEKTMDLKNYEWQSDFAKTHEARGEAKSILLVLDARGIDVPAEIRSRVNECTDLELLARLVRRAAVIESADELFD